MTVRIPLSNGKVLELPRRPWTRDKQRQIEQLTLAGFRGLSPEEQTLALRRAADRDRRP